MRTLALLAVAIPAWAATGDILAVRIVASTCTAGSICNGWVAEIDIDGLSTGGTYAFGLGTNNDPSTAKMVLTVTSPGYDSSGSATTTTRTIYSTQWLRKPFPNQAVADETAGAGYITVRVSLSDFIYSGDTSVVANIGAGLYTGGSASNAATGVSVTNNSTLAYPSPIGRWAWTPYELVSSSTYLIEASIFSRFARNGQPMAAVVFSCADTHSHTTSQTVSGMTVSTRSGDPNKVLVYAATMNLSGMTSGDQITCNFTAYPWVGNNSLVSSGTSDPNEALTPLVFTYSTGYGGAFAVVDVTNGNDSSASTWVYSSQAAAEAAYAGDNTLSYKYVGRALNGIKAYNNTNYSRNEAGGGTVLVTAGTHDWPGSALATGTNVTWATVMPISTAAQSAVIFGANAGSLTFQAGNKIKITGVSITASSGTLFRGASNADHLWLHANALNFTGTNLVFNNKYSYFTQNTGILTASGFAGAGVIDRIVRGNNIPAGNGVSAEPYAVMGNNGVLPNTWKPVGFSTVDNGVLAFNSMYNTTGTVSFTTLTVSTGLAVVQNLIEEMSTVNLIFGPCADGCTGTTNNIIMWHNTFTGQRVNAGYNDGGGTGANWATSYPQTNWSLGGNLFDTFNNKDDTFAPLAGTKVPSAITQANPGVVTSNSHGFANGDKVYFYGIGGMTQLNGTTQTVAGVTTNTFTIADTTAMSAFTSGGSMTSANPARVGSWPVGYRVGGYGEQITAASSSDFGGEFVGINTVYGNGVYGFVSDQSSTTHGSGTGYGNYHLTRSSTALNRIPSAKAVLPYDLEGTARRNDGTGAAGAYEFGSTIRRRFIQ